MPLTIVVNTSKIAIALPVPIGSGEANTAANVGGQQEVFRDKVGAVLNFRTLKGVKNVAITTVVDTLEIGLADWNKDEFTPSNNQVTFVLSSTPEDPTSVIFEVNGVIYDDIADWTVLGNTVSWTDVPFQMQTTDHVVVRYR